MRLVSSNHSEFQFWSKSSTKISLNTIWPALVGIGARRSQRQSLVQPSPFTLFPSSHSSLDWFTS